MSINGANIFKSILKPILLDISVSGHRFPLILQSLAHHVYIFILVYVYEGDRYLFHYFALVGFGYFADYILQLIFRKNPKPSLPTAVICSSIFLLLSTRGVFYPYVIAVLIGLLSKYLFLSGKNHIFNPSCIGLLFSVCIFSDKASLSQSQWLGEIEILLVFAFVGTTVSYFAQRLAVSISYLVCLLGAQFLMNLASGADIRFLTGAVISLSGLIFVFHMITDPKTTPANIKEQLAFGGGIALLDFYLRRAGLPFSQLLALNTASVIYFWLKEAKAIR